MIRPPRIAVRDRDHHKEIAARVGSEEMDYRVCRGIMPNKSEGRVPAGRSASYLLSVNIILSYYYVQKPERTYKLADFRGIPGCDRGEALQAGILWGLSMLEF
jgi:hypothetical protein